MHRSFLFPCIRSIFIYTSFYFPSSFQFLFLPLFFLCNYSSRLSWFLPSFISLTATLTSSYMFRPSPCPLPPPFYCSFFPVPSLTLISFSLSFFSSLSFVRSGFCTSLFFLFHVLFSFLGGDSFLWLSFSCRSLVLSNLRHRSLTFSFYSRRFLVLPITRIPFLSC